MQLGKRKAISKSSQNTCCSTPKNTTRESRDTCEAATGWTTWWSNKGEDFEWLTSSLCSTYTYNGYSIACSTQSTNYPTISQKGCLNWSPCSTTRSAWTSSPTSTNSIAYLTPQIDRHRLLHPVRTPEGPALPKENDETTGRPRHTHHHRKSLAPQDRPSQIRSRGIEIQDNRRG